MPKHGCQKWWDSQYKLYDLYHIPIKTTKIPSGNHIPIILHDLCINLTIPYDMIHITWFAQSLMCRDIKGLPTYFSKFLVWTYSNSSWFFEVHALKWLPKIAPYVLVWFVTHCHVSFAMLHSSINSFSISLVIGFNYKLFYMQNILNCTRTEFHRTLNLLIQVPLTQQDGGKQLLMNSCLNVFANENATVSCADSAAWCSM